MNTKFYYTDKYYYETILKALKLYYKKNLKPSDQVKTIYMDFKSISSFYSKINKFKRLYKCFKKEYKNYLKYKE